MGHGSGEVKQWWDGMRVSPMAWDSMDGTWCQGASVVSHKEWSGRDGMGWQGQDAVSHREWGAWWADNPWSRGLGMAGTCLALLGAISPCPIYSSFPIAATDPEDESLPYQVSGTRRPRAALLPIPGHWGVIKALFGPTLIGSLPGTGTWRWRCGDGDKEPSQALGFGCGQTAP